MIISQVRAIEEPQTGAVSSFCGYTFRALNINMTAITEYPENHDPNSPQFRSILNTITLAEDDYAFICGVRESMPGNIDALIPTMAKPLLQAVYHRVRACLVQPWWDLDEIEPNLNALFQSVCDQAAEILFPKPPAVKVRNNKGFVYLLRNQSGLYKIGRTNNPENRMHTFEVKLPFKVQYRCLIETDDMFALEKSLHKYFAKHRIEGEWFRLSPMDVRMIEGLSEGKSFEVTQSEVEAVITTLPLFKLSSEGG